MAVQIPVAAVGVIRSPETADALIEAGDADFIAIGRGLIADPYWPQKALAGESDSIRRCISCLTCTARRVNDNLPICCAINPEAGHEGEIREIRIGMKFQTPKKITVVGGGPAGMYAAVSLQKLGHDVTLMESRQQLGGQLRLASVPPCKDKINWLVAYLEKSLAAAGVTVQLGVHADVDHIKATGAALVVVATGAKPFVPPIAGADKSLVITAHALLGEQKTYRDLDIVVIGGGSVGCETAEYLAEGNRVTVVEMRDDFAIDLKPYNKSDLVKRLNETTIQILTQTQVASIEDDGVNCQKRHADGSTEMLHLAADKVVMAVGSTPERTLANALEAASIDAICIGDCTAPKQIIDALRQGFVMIKQQSAL
jgi:NADPH-dependent 2,4-dienoyl-CoA reductase/sulfur reductase-like enzyme